MLRRALPVVLLVSLVAACSASTTSGPAASAPVTAGPTGATSAAPRPTSSSSVPAGLLVSDLSWLSDDEGWLLGSTLDCASRPCTVVLHTRDGGTTWVRAGAPPLHCSADPCVSTIRFTSSLVGYVAGGDTTAGRGASTSAYTVDGGGHWSVEVGPAVVALEPDQGDVLRVVADSPCEKTCTFHLQRGDAGSADWGPVDTPATSGSSVRLVRAGTDVYLVTYQNPTGGEQDSQPDYAVSHDSGSTWTAGRDPCLTLPRPQDGGEIDTAQITAVPGGILTVVCRPRGDGDAAVLRSTDSGQTFTTVTSGSRVDDLLAGTGLAQLDATTLITVGSGVEGTGPREISLSTDGGATFTPVQEVPPIPSTQERVSDGYAGAQDEHTARVVPVGVSTVFTTRDGGRTWTSHAFT